MLVYTALQLGKHPQPLLWVLLDQGCRNGHYCSCGFNHPFVKCNSLPSMMHTDKKITGWQSCELRKPTRCCGTCLACMSAERHAEGGSRAHLHAVMAACQHNVIWLGRIVITDVDPLHGAKAADKVDVGDAVHAEEEEAARNPLMLIMMGVLLQENLQNISGIKLVQFQGTGMLADIQEEGYIR